MIYLYWLVGSAFSLLILWAVINSAVKSALQSHYKTVRLFEATGEWFYQTTGGRTPPRSFSDTK